MRPTELAAGTLAALLGRMNALAAAEPSPPAISKLGVLQHNNQFHLVATAPIDAGEALLRVEGELTHTPTRYSLQVDAARHIDVPVGTSLREQLEHYRWSFLNHACEPNAAFRGLTLVAMRAIRQGEDITFHYATTEYEMAEPFHCRCGSPLCLGEIRGFRHLPPAAVERLRPWCAPHLLARRPETEDASLSA